jgi:hypothetical protein
VPQTATYGKAIVRELTPNLTSKPLIIRSARPSYPCLNEHHGLRAGDIETFTAGTAGQHIVDAHHIVARVLKLAFVLLAGAPRRRGFFSALQPTYLVIVPRATVRAAEAGGL